MMQSASTGNGTRLRILCVGAFPPPVSGQALAMQLLWDGLSTHHDLERYDISDPLERVDYITAARRAVGLALTNARVIRSMSTRSSCPTVLYLQLGQSSRAMLRDLPMLMWAMRTGRPVVGHVHGNRYADGFMRLPSRVQRVVASVMRRVDVIVLSDSLAVTVTSAVCPREVHSIANGVEPIVFNAALTNVRAGVLPGSPVRVLFLGNLIAKKGYLEALEAARLAQEEGFRLQLTLAGPVTAETTFHPEDFIRRHGLQNATYVGAVEGTRKIELLRHTDVMLLPSLTEGQPLSILEAMHFGIPVLAYPVGGVSDAMGPGADGLLLSMGGDGSQQILEKIRELAQSPEIYRRVSAALLERARRRNSPSVHIQQVESVLLGAVSACASAAWSGRIDPEQPTRGRFCRNRTNHPPRPNTGQPG